MGIFHFDTYSSRHFLLVYVININRCLQNNFVAQQIRFMMNALDENDNGLDSELLNGITFYRSHVH